jgi:hypothetical protein
MFGLNESALYLLDQDPRIYHGACRNRTAHTGLMLIEAARNAVSLLSSSALPVVFHHGADDIVTLPAGAEWCHANWSTAKGATKALHIHAGLRHELFSEPIKGAEVCRHATMHDSEHHNSNLSYRFVLFLCFVCLPIDRSSRPSAPSLPRIFPQMTSRSVLPP